MYAQIVFPIASFKTFTYNIPSYLISKLSVGSCVNVPFKQKITTGYIVSISTKISFKGKINDIESINYDKSIIPADLWKTIIWMSKYYIAPLGLCIKSALPSSLFKNSTTNSQLHIEMDKSAPNKLDSKILSNPNVNKIIQELNNSNTPIPVSILKKKIPNIYYWINILSSKGVVNKLHIDNMITPSISYQKTPIKLSSSQQFIYDKIITTINQNIYQAFLIHGVPGSGKTEIYTKLAQQAIENGNNVIVLIPEIILTTQMKERFIKYFGDSICIWHSKMTPKEKRETLSQINTGQSRIIIGARSSIFCPIPNLGLIIVDEEQDTSYKQESPKPYYNARDIAMIRASYANCPVILSSATPSLETYYNTVNNKIKLLELNEKYFKSKQPTVQLVDMMKIYDKDGNQQILSPLLIDSIKDTLKEGKQCLLLNNRRGYSSSIFLKSENQAIMCIDCNVPMSYHQSINKLLCHYCGYDQDYTNSDIINNSDNIILKGHGTEKIQSLIREHFPNTIIERADSDSLKNKSKMKLILKNFSNGKINILLGTQMISKGLDFDNVKLIGVINADYGMFTPDFRSGERTFQIISQIIGRSGRRDEQGKAIIQTYNPDDKNLQDAIHYRFKRNYSSNLSERKELGYPPFTRLCRLTFSGFDLNSVNRISKDITKIFIQSSDFKILGPVEAPISKIKNKWRYHTFILSSKKPPMRIQEFFYDNIGTKLLEKYYKDVNIKLDIDPLNML